MTSHNIKVIAAAAIEQGYAILTENLRHFEKIPELVVKRIYSAALASLPRKCRTPGARECLQ